MRKITLILLGCCLPVLAWAETYTSTLFEPKAGWGLEYSQSQHLKLKQAAQGFTALWGQRKLGLDDKFQALSAAAFEAFAESDYQARLAAWKKKKSEHDQSESRRYAEEKAEDAQRAREFSQALRKHKKRLAQYTAKEKAHRQALADYQAAIDKGKQAKKPAEFEFKKPRFIQKKPQPQAVPPRVFPQAEPVKNQDPNFELIGWVLSLSQLNCPESSVRLRLDDGRLVFAKSRSIAAKEFERWGKKARGAACEMMDATTQKTLGIVIYADGIPWSIKVQAKEWELKRIISPELQAFEAEMARRRFMPIDWSAADQFEADFWETSDPKLPKKQLLLTKEKTNGRIKSTLRAPLGLYSRQGNQAQVLDRVGLMEPQKLRGQQILMVRRAYVIPPGAGLSDLVFFADYRYLLEGEQLTGQIAFQGESTGSPGNQAGIMTVSLADVFATDINGLIHQVLLLSSHGQVKTQLGLFNDRFLQVVNVAKAGSKEQSYVPTGQTDLFDARDIELDQWQVTEYPNNEPVAVFWVNPENHGLYSFELTTPKRSFKLRWIKNTEIERNLEWARQTMRNHHLKKL